MASSNLKTHYTSYYESAKKDLFEDFGAFALITPTNEPSKYSNFGEYLRILIADVSRAIEECSAEQYYAAILSHRFALIQIMEKMVEVKMEEHGDYVSLINKAGWEYFRFSKCRAVVVTFTDDFPAKRITIVPRYSKDTPAEPYVFDADEILLLKGLSWDTQKELLCAKTAAHTKLLSLDESPVPFHEVNSHFFGIRDWKMWGAQ